MGGREHRTTPDGTSPAKPERHPHHALRVSRGARVCLRLDTTAHVKICPRCSELQPDESSFCPTDGGILEKSTDPHALVWYYSLWSGLFEGTTRAQQPALRKLGYPTGSFPESERAAAEVLALPLFAQLTFAEQEIVVAAIADFMS